MAAEFTFTDEQKHIIVDTDPDSDVLIIAGAGSGKTFTMTQRIIHLVTEEKNPDGSPIAPGSVLGLTFTKKAAEELRSRVTNAVSAVMRANGTTTAAQRLTGQPHVYTYDSFFQQIVRQYGLLIGVDPAAVPLSPAGRVEIVQRAADSMMDRITAEMAKRDPEVDGEFLRWTPKYEQLVAAGLSISDGCLSYMIDGDHLTIDSAFDRLSAWNDAFAAKMRELLLKEKAQHPDWYAEALAATKTIAISSGKSRSKKPDKVAVAQREQQRTIAESSIQRVKKLYDVARARAVAIEVARAYAQEKNSNHLADYADFTARAFQLLKRFPSIGREYRQRFRYVFLDEFQDTSTTQTKLLIALFHPKSGALQSDAPSESGGNAGSAAPDFAMPDSDAFDPFARSVVTAVGDPFQSIYGWRGASPNAFLIFKDGFELDDEPCSLSQTHRNKKLILDCANDMTELMRAKEFPTRNVENTDIRDALRINVKELTAMNAGETRDGADEDAADIGTVATMAYPTIQAEALAIAKFARHMIARLKEEGTDFSKFVGAPVAVLMRSKQSMFDYRRAIEATGLRCRIVGYADLLTQPESEDLFSVLTILTDKNDLGTVMRLLASPRYSMNADDLQKLAKIASRFNEDLQYRSLVEAGIATGEEDRARKDAVIREHRDSLPTMGTLADLLCSDDLLTVLDGPDMKAMGLRLSDHGLRSAVECGHVLRKAEAAIPRGVAATVRAAADALGLSADLAVAEAIDNSGVVDMPEAWGDLELQQPVKDQAKRSNRADRESKLDAVFAMITQYQAELPEDQNATLGGFVLWSQKEMTSEAQPPQAYNDRADVVIMTIHQSKGLEWPAVIIADVEKTRFPSKGSVQMEAPSGKESEKEGDDPDGIAAGILAALAGDGNEKDLSLFHASKNSMWTDDIGQIPAPLRSDAADLPEFPHGSRQTDPIAALDMLTSTREVRQEIDAPDVRETPESGLRAEFLSLQEKYGMRSYIDELRLLYVALTRSSGDLLLTFHSHAYEEKPSELTLDESKASIFWQGVCRALEGFAKQKSYAMAEAATPMCAGRAAGTNAQELLDALMLTAKELGAQTDQNAADEEADDESSTQAGQDEFSQPSARIIEAARLLHEKDLSSRDLSVLYQAALAGYVKASESKWPVTIGPQRQMTLDLSALAVRKALSEGDDAAAKSGDDSAPLTSRARTLLKFAHVNVGNDADNGSVGSEDGVGNNAESASQTAADASLIQRARAAAAGTSISTTSLQRMIAHDSAESVTEVAKAILRPMPRPPYAAAASKGTRFHAWAADILSARIGEVADPSDATTARTIDDSDQENLTAEEKAWRTRFLDARACPWITRTPDVIEQEYDVVIEGHRVPAKFDAVFRGALADSPGSEQQGRYTIVDWKTGRPPKNAEERAERLLQLDIYRYAFSIVRGVEIGEIDACLYYVSEPNPDARQINADSTLDAEDILARIRNSTNFTMLFADE